MMRKRFTVIVIAIVMMSMAVASVNVLSPVGPTIVSLVGILEDKVETESEVNIEFWSSFDAL
jgi:phosphotransferase system  glucose/maltose/N-acetylglucosamine-specific IIC component